MTYEEFQRLNNQEPQQLFECGWIDSNIHNLTRGFTPEHAAYKFLQQFMEFSNFTGSTIKISVRSRQFYGFEFFTFQFPRLEPEMFFPKQVYVSNKFVDQHNKIAKGES
jgi:hypothetical protein